MSGGWALQATDIGEEPPRRAPVHRQSGAPLDGDFAFAAAVAEFGMLLRDSEFKGDASWAGVRELARRGMGEDVDGLRAEFLSLAGRAAGIVGRGTPFSE